MGMSLAQVRIVRRLVEECWSGGNLDAVEELFAPDCVTHTMFREHPILHGRDEQRQAIRSLHATFADLAFTVEDCLAGSTETGEAQVVCRWSASGTHTRSYLNVPPTGRRVTWAGATVYRFQGDRIAEDWWYLDRYLIFQQLVDHAAAQANA